MASKRESLIASAEKSLQKGKVDAALKDYLKVLDETPADINILNKVGDLNVRLGKNEDSIPFFLRIAEHYARDGFYVRAIAMYKKINKLDPSRLDIYEKLAELYVKQQLWMEAKSNYQVLADYLLKQDNLTGAIGIYQKMVAIEPQNLQLHVKLADLFTQAKRIQEALKEYAVVAAALSERGAHDESIRVYEKALRLAPDNVDILKTLVPLLVSMNSLDQARAVLRKGLEASPRSVPLFLMSAEAALAANDVAEARSFSEKARAVEPDSEEVLAAAVRIQLKGRRPDLAWAAASPLADAAVRRGEPKKALALLVPIARAAPDADDVVKKIVDVAAGAGDEATALPYRSALAELYRKKGKVAEAADLLRLCMRVQPDNAEFRARLAQLEPSAPVVSVVPPRVPPSTIERNLEVSISGFGPGALRPPAPAPAPEPPPPPPPAREAEAAVEFEFDLGEVEAAEEASAPEAAEAPPTPPRGLAAARREPTGIEDVEPWGTLTAAEALEAFEEREAEASRKAGRAPAVPEAEEVEELLPGAEVVSAVAGAFPALDLELPTPAGFGPPPSFEIPAIPDVTPAEPEEWIPASLPAGESFPEAGLDESVSLGPASRGPGGDAALEDALVEAEVFRRYGLLDKAIDQIQPLLERDPANVRVREKVFEIHLEQGNREIARSHAEVLAAAYEADGREERIRGLEALLGEPLRLAAVAAPAPAPEPPAAEERAEGAPEPESARPPSIEIPLAAGLEAALPSAAPVEPLEPEEDFAPVPSAEALPSDFGAVDQPTEIISAIAPPVLHSPAEPAPAPVLEPAAPAEAVEAAPAAAELPPGEAPLPAPEEPERPPAVPPARSGPPTTKTKLSAELVLGLGRATEPAPAAPKKARAVRPDDLDALLGGRDTKPKGKAKPPKSEPVLPDDLLSALQKPAARRADPPAPLPPAAAQEEEVEASRVEAAPPGPPPPAGPATEELQELDFCLDQGMVVDAAERLQALEGRFPGDPELDLRRQRLEGGRGSSETSRAALHDILSDDLDSVLDAELGRALTEDMVREAGPGTTVPAAPPAPAGPALDESGLFSDEQEFFNFADELHTELRGEAELPQAEEGREVSLEEIFRDFKKGVEQQLSPEDYETHYNLGIAYKEMGLTDEAIGEFQLAAKDPLHAVECCAMLGLCFLEKGLPQLAVKWYRKGLETIGIRDEDRLGLQYALAGVLEQVGDREAAYRAYLEIFGASASYRDVADRLRDLKPYAAS